MSPEDTEIRKLSRMSQPAAPKNAAEKASTVKKIFSRETSVQITIEAKPAVIWSLLTDAANYQNWNSTVVSIEGRIALNETIRLISKLAPTRVFKLRIKQFEPNRRMAWGDAMGTRVYQMDEQPNGKVHFTMTEKIGGPIFPLFAKLIPSFDASFETFAADLKKAAEFAKQVG